VAFEEAARDWVSNHAFSWRQRRQAHMLELQRQEILRHKWIESEKARRDLGRDVVLDWIKDHAAKWREWYEQNFEKEADF